MKLVTTKTHTHSHIWELNIPTSAKLIMLFLSSIEVNAKGETSPLVEDIGAYCGLSRLSVKKHLAFLVDKGMLKRTLVPAHTSLYKVLVK